MNQQLDPQQSPMSIAQGQHLSDQINSLLQRIAELERQLTWLNSEPTADEGYDQILQITALLVQLVENGLRHEQLLLEIRQDLDSGMLER